jgi:asparagine synthase (glutamine-hydrolysing)
MCGIGGYFLRNGERAAADTLDRMDRALAHRGPDGGGRFVDAHCGFVHRRLSIIDVDHGAQPFTHATATGLKVLMANGEIYNHRALRDQYTKGFPFGSQSDCETLLGLWVAMGDSYIAKLRGMFAIATYDDATKSGLLARDPFGIKPLFVVEAETGVYFASEQTALLDLGFGGDAPSLIHAASIIDQQLAPDDIVAFPPIRRVKPGEVLHVKNGKIENSVITSPIDGMADAPSDPADFEARLADTLLAHLMSDVPVGMFFSGGVDSSAILAGFQQLKRTGKIDEKHPLIAYTTRFADRPDQEFEIAKTLAGAAAVEFVDVPYGKTDFWQGAGLAVKACEDAVADYAILPTTKLAARAKQDIKVILSGEGGDESFAGYGRYRSGARGLFAKTFIRRGAALRHGVFDRDLSAQLMKTYAVRAANMPDLMMRLFDRDTTLATLQREDFRNFLANDLLIKLDRCLMINGVEGRTPFVDRDMSLYGLSLPYAAKINHGVGKLVVKKWLNAVMPLCEPFRQKQGFTVPVGKWIAAESSRLVPLVAAQPGIAPLIPETKLQAIFTAANGRGGLLAWRILFYALWHQVHLFKIDASGTIDEILAQRP